MSFSSRTALPRVTIRQRRRRRRRGAWQLGPSHALQFVHAIDHAGVVTGDESHAERHHAAAAAAGGDPRHALLPEPDGHALAVSCDGIAIRVRPKEVILKRKNLREEKLSLLSCYKNRRSCIIF